MRRAASVLMLSLLLIGMLTLMFDVQTVTSETGWVWVRDTITGDYGEAVVGTGDAIYVARGTSFYRYNPIDNSWSVLAAPPNPDSSDAFKTGTALAWDFGDYVYALCGAATGDSRRWFYRYSISSNVWESLANTTADQGEGDAMTWVDIENCAYATIGGEQRPTYLVRYDPSTNSWSDEPADPAFGMGDGASLVWAGGDFLYALRGEFFESTPLYDFWRYSLTDDVWTRMADIPASPWGGGVGGVGDGGSLLFVGFWVSSQMDYVYALSGNQVNEVRDNRSYRYTMSTNGWERLADLSFEVGYYVGCRLGYADGHIYAWQGAPSTWPSGGDDLARYVIERVDIAVTNVTQSKAVVGQGYNVSIFVTVENQGDFSEVFNVTVYCNETVISLLDGKNYTTITLTSENSTTVTFKWNTTSVSKGNYTISVTVDEVLGETDTTDNMLVGGWVFVTIAGDVDGDRDVDIFDIVRMACSYNTEEGDPKYIANCDIDGDGDIDMYDIDDIVISAGNYGESW